MLHGWCDLILILRMGCRKFLLLMHFKFVLFLNNGLFSKLVGFLKKE